MCRHIRLHLHSNQFPSLTVNPSLLNSLVLRIIFLSPPLATTTSYTVAMRTLISIRYIKNFHLNFHREKKCSIREFCTNQSSSSSLPRLAKQKSHNREVKYEALKNQSILNFLSNSSPVWPATCAGNIHLIQENCMILGKTSSQTFPLITNWNKSQKTSLSQHVEPCQSA